MSFPIRRVLVAGATGAAVLAVASPAQAVPAASRVAPRVTLDSAPAWTHTAKPVAATSASAKVKLTAVLPLRDQAGAERFATAVSTPGSAQYRRFLTAGQFRARYAPTDATVASVAGWLRKNGFTVGSVPANHRYVPFTGTVGATNSAFGVGLTNYDKRGARVSAPSRSITVPSELAGKVAGISGLDTSAQTTPSRAGAGGDTPKARTHNVPRAAGTSTVTPKDQLPPPGAVFKNAPPCSTYFGQKQATTLPKFQGKTVPYAPCGYKPGQIRSAYGSDVAQMSGYDGRGATVAIVDAYASPTIFADAQTYAVRNDPRHPLRSYQFSQNLPATFTDTVACDAPGWYGEETLDVESVHATAPAAKILYVGAESCNNPDILAAVNTIVDNDLAQIVSNSYGNAGELPAADVVEEHQTYIQAATQGISVLFSSGDSGDDVKSTGKRQVDYPAADPYVTAVGGTSLKVAQDGSNAGEDGWETFRYALAADGKSWVNGAYQYGAGGGVSTVWGQPAYQKGVVPASISQYGGLAKPGRAVPDVAAVGDPNTGFLVGQTQTFPDGSLKYSEYRIGGTSLSCPLLAGLTAVANQVAGGPLGFLNPKLYKLAGTAAFNDVAVTTYPDGAVARVDYVNGVDGADGTTTTLRTLGSKITIFTRPGYDDVTGVGTPNGVNFLLGVAGAKARVTSPSGRAPARAVRVTPAR